MTAFFPATIIKASAGSGKTRAITNRFISLLLAGEKVERILATTFTKKAAGEIKARVINRIADALNSKDHFSDLKSAINQPSLTTPELLNVLKRLVSELNRLNISTLDSFFIKMARAFCFELGLSNDWRIAEAAQRENLIQEVVRTLCSSAGYSDLAEMVSQLSTKEAEVSIHGFLLTEIPLIQALVSDSNLEAWSWNHPSDPFHDDLFPLAVSSIQKIELPKTKAGEVDKRWLNSLKKVEVLLKEQSWAKLVDQGLIQAAASEQGKFFSNPLSVPMRASLAPIVSILRAVYSRTLSNKLSAGYQLGTEYAKLYRERSFRAQQFEFSDIKSILKDGVGLGALDQIYFRLDSQISHLLLDEFQDTSATEWHVLEPFVAEILSKAEGEQSFFCVGDVKQAIYDWRGGVAEIFDTIQRRWPHLDLEKLDSSYRSAPQIIDTVNKVFTSISAIPVLDEFKEVVQDWQKRFSVHDTAKKNLLGHVQLLELEVPEAETFLHKVIDDVEIIFKKHIYSDVAILVRSNKVVPTIISLLAQKGIKASEAGGIPLLVSPAVSSIVALLRHVDAPGDTIALEEVKASPLGSELLANGISLDAAGLAEYFHKKLALSGFGATIKSLSDTISKYYTAEDLAYLTKLSDLAFDYQDKFEGRVNNFVQLVTTKKVESGGSEVVTVMTIHQSKGLEFDCVILPELDSPIVDRTKRSTFIPFREDPVAAPSKIVPGVSTAVQELFPEIKEVVRASESRILKEALSLLYVALTRAKRGLYMYSESDGGKRATFGQILKQTLGEQRGSNPSIIYEVGSVESLSPAVQRLSETFPVPSTIKFNRSDKYQRGSSVVAPSDLNGDGEVDLKNVFSSEGDLARNRGMVIHNILEKVSWLEEGQFLSNKDFDRPFGIDPQTFEEAWQVVYKAVENPIIRPHFLRQTYNHLGLTVKLFKEKRFAYRKLSQIFNGAIDRLVVGFKDDVAMFAEVVDYKSGLDPNKAAAQYYAPQINCYREAVSSMFNISIAKVRAKIIMLEQLKVIEM